MSTPNQKPAGLARFNRVIRTKYSNPCTFCGTATTVGTDWAFLNSAGKWLAACSPCASSTVESVKGVIRSIDAIATDGADLSTVTMPNMDEVAAVIAGQRPEAVALAILRDVVIMRREVKAAVAVTAPAAVHAGPTPAASITPGLYVMGDPADWSSYWLVREGRRSGHNYAMRLSGPITEGVKLDWEYVRGGMSAVARSARPATAEEAAALGHTTHHCCFCARELTDEGEGRSVEVGYGPICARKNGLPWG